MARRRSSRSKDRTAFGFVLLLILLAFAPYVAVLGGLALFLWFVVKIVRALAPAAPSPTVRPPGSAPPVDTLRLRSARTLTGQLVRGGRWQTQLARLEQARSLADELHRLTPPGWQFTATTPIIGVAADLKEAISSATATLLDDLTGRYTDELARLRSTTSPTRTLRTAQSLAEELADITTRLPDLAPLRDRFAPPLDEILRAVRSAEALKSGLADARSLERSGDKLAALDSCLALLHTLRTDSIPDAEQADPIATLESRVRDLVRSCYVPERPTRRRSRPTPRPEEA